MRYAEQTSVSTEKSKAEIERTLQRYGADQFMSGWDQERAYIGFRMQGKMIKFMLELPDKGKFRTTPGGRRRRSDSDLLKAWEQSCRQRWRALALVIKAKLEAVETGITTFEEEFLAHILLPDGRTAGDYLIPQIHMAYEKGEMPVLLPWSKDN